MLGITRYSSLSSHFSRCFSGMQSLSSLAFQSLANPFSWWKGINNSLDQAVPHRLAFCNARYHPLALELINGPHCGFALGQLTVSQIILGKNKGVNWDELIFLFRSLNTSILFFRGELNNLDVSYCIPTGADAWGQSKTCLLHWCGCNFMVL